MGPDVVVVVAPEGQFAAGISQAVEDFLVQAFVAQAVVEAFDVAILLRLARVDVVPFDAVRVGPFQDGLAGELGSVVADDASGLAVNPDAVDPLAWLADTLARIPDYKITKVDDLLPWRWNG